MRKTCTSCTLTYHITQVRNDLGIFHQLLLEDPAARLESGEVEDGNWLGRALCLS